ncbi:NHLP bacteriocin export ABC transporter permease/ATPase subunit [Gemmatimonas sp.]|uniref:NHLP bacteriocin export ABC transporter permease/ATPase subunit n=1 Tax=Gemmatimonas sp. TaxID=1962908 RepID=UPI00333E8119
MTTQLNLHVDVPADAPGAEFFARHGEPRQVGSATPFLLRGNDVWLIASGYVDVFSVMLDGPRPRGPRSHFVRVTAGTALFGEGDHDDVSGRALLAVGAPDTRLLRVDRSWLRELAGTTDGVVAAMPVVERWVETLCMAMADGVQHGPLRKVTGRQLDLQAGEDLSLATGMQACGRDGVVWVRHSVGHTHMLGRDELLVNGTGFTPLSAHVWLEAREAGRLQVTDRSRMGDPDVVFDGLDRLHRLVLRYADAAANDAGAAERERLRRRTLANQRTLRDACSQLVATLDPQVQGAPSVPMERHAQSGARPAPLDATAIEDLTFAAAQRVGTLIGVTLRSYPRGDGLPSPADPLAAIARASRVRIRQVALRADWWESDNGPMMGTLAANEESADAAPEALGGPAARPVALVPTRNGRGYTIEDPLSGASVRVDANMANRLEPFAYTFYRSFPNRALTVMDVARFGLRGCGRDVAMVVFMGLAGALLGLVPSMAIGMMFNDVIPGAQRDQLVQLTVVLIACALATALFNATRSVALLRVEGRMGTTVQAAIWDRLLALPMSFFRPYTAGDLAVRAMGIDSIRQVVSGATVSALLGGVFSLVNFGLMFWYSSVMAWKATLLIVVAVAIASTGSLLQLRHQRVAVGIHAKVSGVVLQLLMGVAKLRVAGAETRAFSRWATRFADQRQRQFRAERVGNVVQAVQGSFPIVASLVLFWAALPLLASGNVLPTGNFLAFLSAYGSAQGALLGTCTALLSTLSTVPLYEQARPILTTEPEVDEAKGDPGLLTGEIALDHVYFRYSVDGPPTLRDLSLRVKPGEFVALVGPSGSGKSTILRLLLGFEQPESGVVSYDGQDLAGLDVQAVRRQIGVVLQNGQLMSGDIFTNIAGSARVTIDEAWEASRMAGFDEDVNAMPMGMHTVISEGAATLSGGQRQRLMIARAIVQRPRILFFDEATSALDNRTQAIVSASLDRLRATRVVVAHRLSTVVNADRIVVVERGQVVQQGRYDELLAQPGPFAELARRQLA